MDRIRGAHTLFLSKRRFTKLHSVLTPSCSAVVIGLSSRLTLQRQWPLTRILFPSRLQ